jgi:LPXTG-motif cell wall-anchored protein
MWLVRALVGGTLIGLGALFGLAFYYRYWLWRDCFNELGRCYDPVGQEVYLEQAGIVWGSLAGLCLAGGLLLLLRRRR